MNKVMIQGNLTKDVELRYTQNQKAVAQFTVAANESYVQDGEKKDRVAYINCVAWGKLGENISTLTKGNAVFVEGRLQTRSYEKDGIKRYVTEVVAEFIGQSLNQVQTASADNFDMFGEEVPF